jgi:hypothetical protein
MLYKNVKFSPHPLQTVKPFPPHPKRNPWKPKIPMLHFTSSHLNPIFKEPPTPPTQETFIGKKKKKKKINPLSKNSFGKGGKKPSPSFFLLNFHLITLPHPHLTLLDLTQL